MRDYVFYDLWDEVEQKNYYVCVAKVDYEIFGDKCHEQEVSVGICESRQSAYDDFRKIQLFVGEIDAIHNEFINFDLPN